MDLQLTGEQSQLEGAVADILKRYDGRERHKTIGGALDRAALDALAELGYLDVFRDAGPVEAVLVVERAADAAVRANVSARVLVGPMIGEQELPAAVGLAYGGRDAMVRYGAECEAFLVIDGDTAVVATSDEVTVEPVESGVGPAYGRVQLRGGRRLGAGSAADLRRAWQVALAVEAGHVMLSAIAQTADHVSQRYQFGQPIGAFQAVQHRLSRAYAMATGTKWLARRAAWSHDQEFLTASAAAFACEAAEVVYTNCHQVSGAIGITSEFGLTDQTLRLYAIRRELGGKTEHQRNVARARRAMDRAGQLMPVHV